MLWEIALLDEPLPEPVAVLKMLCRYTTALDPTPEAVAVLCRTTRCDTAEVPEPEAEAVRDSV